MVLSIVSFATTIAIVVVGSTAVPRLEEDLKPEERWDRPRCLDTARHKSSPSLEEELYKTCNVYGGSSCCTNETAVTVHTGELYNFEKLTCQNSLSPKCKNFFLKDACFFECSPDIARWAVIGEDKQEFVKDVPLCRSDCENWFEACADATTCTTNWRAAHDDPNFSCIGDNKNCQTFKKKFGTAETFCREIWGKSYDVVSDTDRCVKIDLSTRQDQENNHFPDEDNSGSSTMYNVVIIALPAMFFAVGNLIL
ncbi:Folate receptor [Nesidiocoris tenuis]|uniref:Folate receptor n=1 Tax=Nesidiocoris tenuis TaxID=355587 RepID=A0ABN7AHR3_9HEMI|nr:Folate receptor [Nesidiocoris tenuis]